MNQSAQPPNKVPTNQNHNFSSYPYSFDRTSNSYHNDFNRNKSKIVNHLNRLRDNSSLVDESYLYRKQNHHLANQDTYSHSKISHASIEKKYENNPCPGKYADKPVSEEFFQNRPSIHKKFKYEPSSILNSNHNDTHQRKLSMFDHRSSLAQKQHRLTTEPDNEGYKRTHEDSYNWRRSQPYYREASASYTNNKYQQSHVKQMNQQKISNIEKINNKIKQILSTLNEEQKKMNSGQQFKIANSKKKTYGYNGRIRTEGDVSDYSHCQYNNSSQVNRKMNEQMHANYRPQYLHQSNQAQCQKSQIHDENGSTVYSRLQSIKNKYDHKYRQEVSFQTEKLRNPLGEIDSNYGGRKAQNLPGHSSLNNKTNFDNMEIENFESFSGIAKWDNNNYLNSSKSRIFQENYERHSMKYSNMKSSQFNHTNEQNNYDHYANQASIKNENNFKNDEKCYARNNLSTPSRKTFIQESYSEHSQFKRSHISKNQKNYDQEIQKIQSKIQAFEDLKKQIGINDSSPNKVNIREMMNISHSRAKSFNNQNKERSQERRVKISEKKVMDNASNITKGTGRFLSQFSCQPSFSKESSCLVRSNHETSEESGLSQISIPKPLKLCSKRNNKKISSVNGSNIIESQFISEQRLKEDSNLKDSILYRSKMMLTEKTHDTGSITRDLIQKLCRQISYDTDLRDLKKWFTKKNSPYKWMEIKKQLQLGLCQIEKTVQQYSPFSRAIHRIRNQNNEQFLKAIFNLSEEEDNPFYTHRDEDGASYQTLIQSFLSAEEYWVNNIAGKYQKSWISGLSEEIDIDHKGFITMEDLVRYINIESDQYYRNRDISLIYRRLENKKHSWLNCESNRSCKIMFSEIVEELCFDAHQQQ